MTQKCLISSLLTELQLIDETIYLNDRELEYVWIQGVITGFSPENNEIRLDDGTGAIMVLLPSELLNDEFSIGNYVMVHGILVVGEDESTGEEVIFVSGRMISVLEDPNYETLWMLEILHQNKREIKR